MHFVVSWDITAKGERWTAINNDLKSVIDKYSWARPLTTFYIVKVAGQSDWNVILSSLTAKANNHKETIHIVMSPLMQGGQYNGMLPADMWEKINKRTDS